jgi:hypothetical protein
MSVQEQVRKLRDSIDHPVVDGDGHIVESWPLFFRYLAKIGGSDLQERFVRELRERPIFSSGNRASGDPRMPWWGTTTETRDLATVMLPKLLNERVDELGLDFVILYPSLGLVLPTVQDEQVRRGALRALNTMNHELTAPYGSRMAAVAMIPMHSPEEATDEIEYVTEKLGMRVAVIPAGVTGRPDFGTPTPARSGSTATASTARTTLAGGSVPEYVAVTAARPVIATCRPARLRRTTCFILPRRAAIDLTFLRSSSGACLNAFLADIGLSRRRLLGLRHPPRPARALRSATPKAYTCTILRVSMETARAALPTIRSGEDTYQSGGSRPSAADPDDSPPATGRRRPPCSAGFYFGCEADDIVRLPRDNAKRMHSTAPRLF